MADISPAAIGGTLHIRDVTYIIIAVRDNDLLLLEKSEDGAPVQYVVAHGVYQNNGELCWLNGDYFPIPLYPDTVAAIKDAIAHLTEGGDDDNELLRQRYCGACPCHVPARNADRIVGDARPSSPASWNARNRESSGRYCKSNHVVGWRAWQPERYIRRG